MWLLPRSPCPRCQFSYFVRVAALSGNSSGMPVLDVPSEMASTKGAIIARKFMLSNTPARFRLECV
jgi:hypothetical protein